MTFGTTSGPLAGPLVINYYIMKKEPIKIVGEGSIVEVERGRKYRIRFRLPQDETGKRKWSKQRTVNGTKAQARMALEEYRAELEEELNNSFTGLTVGEYVKVFHQKRVDMAILSPLTLERDWLDLKIIISELGDIPVQKLTTSDITETYARLRKQDASHPEGQISQSELFKLHQKLNCILNEAVTEEIIGKNPCAPIKNIRKPAPKERKALSNEQTAQLAKVLKKAERDGKIVAVWLGLATGVRRGEALGLTWGNVDLENGVILISIQLDKNGNLREPKSAKSKRLLHVDNETVQFLEEWKEIQSKFYFNSQPVPDNFPVCSNSQLGNTSNNFLSTSVFDKWRKKFFIDHGLGHYKRVEEWVDSRGIKRVRKIGYEGFNFHELRHTQATLLIAGGADLKTVQNRLGHSKSFITMDNYTHPSEKNDKLAADFMGNILGEV